MAPTIDYADKISKMLRKAEGTDSVAEAEAFREAAFKLMAKYAITEAELNHAKPADQQEQIIKTPIVVTGIYRDALIMLLHRATKAFSVMQGYVIKNTYARYYAPENQSTSQCHIYYVVGFESDVQRMQMLATSLMLQAVSEMNQWWRTTGSKRDATKMEGYKDRREFILNFGDGVGRKISDTMTVAETEVSGTGTALVLRDRKTKVADWLNDNTNLRSTKSRLSSGSYAAGSAGYRAGLRSDIGQTSVES